MAIEVKLTGQAPESHTHAGDWFEFLQGGVLAIHFGDEIRSPQYYSPSAWEYVSAPEPPGQTGNPQVY